MQQPELQKRKILFRSFVEACRSNLGHLLAAQTYVFELQEGFHEAPGGPPQDPQMVPRWPTRGPKMFPGALQVTFVRFVYSWRLVVGLQSMSEIARIVFYTGVFELPFEH